MCNFWPPDTFVARQNVHECMAGHVGSRVGEEQVGAPSRLTLPPDQFTLLEALVSDAPFGFALLDVDLRYVHINESLAALNGLPAAEHRGKTLSDIHPDLDGLVGPMLRRVISTGEPVLGVEQDVVVPGLDERRWYTVNYHPVRLQGDVVGVAGTLIDVTDRHAAAEDMRRHALQQAAVIQLGLWALRGAPTAELVEEAVKVVVDVLEVDHAAVYRKDPKSDDLVLRAIHPPSSHLQPPLRVPVDDDSQARYTFSTTDPVIVADVERETRFSMVRSERGRPVRSSISVQVPAPSGPYGVLGAYHESLRPFSDDDVRFLQGVANVIGTAVDRRRADKALQAAVTRLTMVEEAARVGLWEWDAVNNEVMWSRGLRQLVGIDADPEDRSLDFFLARVHTDDLPRVEALIEAALVDGHYEAEYRVVRPDGSVRWTVARGETMYSADGAPTGMVGISIDITDRKAAEDERTELLRRERETRAEAEVARERLTFLASATQALTQSLDEQTAIASLTRLLVPALADGCLVDLVDTDGRLREAAVSHRDAHVESALRQLRAGYSGPQNANDPRQAVLGGGTSRLFTEVSEEMLRRIAVDERHLELLLASRSSSAMLVGLRTRGRTIGTLSLMRHADGVPFVQDDLALAEELASRAAVALDNARLYDETRRAGERFRRMAETLQASLLPPHLPTIDGFDLAATYLPAAEGVAVGGDFYDVFQLTDRWWGLVIGDVQGKGTEAATLTGLARHTLRTAAIRQSPTRTLETLNEVLLGQSTAEQENRFCTVIYGRLETRPDGATIELTSGGHPPAMVRRTDGSVELIGGGGSLMGVFADVSLRHETVRLAKGDALVLYSDGVTEARRGTDEFGEPRLKSVLESSVATTASDTADEVLQAVTAFSGHRMRDDIAILVVRVA